VTRHPTSEHYAQHNNLIPNRIPFVAIFADIPWADKSLYYDVLSFSFFVNTEDFLDKNIKLLSNRLILPELKPNLTVGDICSKCEGF